LVSASRRPKPAGHTILKYPEVSSKDRQPHVSEDERNLSLSKRGLDPLIKSDPQSLSTKVHDDVRLEDLYTWD